MKTEMQTQELIQSAEADLSGQFAAIESIAFVNQRRVLEAFQAHRLCDEHFVEKSGYGRDDPARQTIDKIFASVFEAESAAVRMQLVSGTHALACALLGNLKAGERLACLTGDPYDTLEEVIGIAGDQPGSLQSLGVSYVQADVEPALTGQADLETLLQPLIEPPTTVAYIQKSCGYSFGRRSLSNQDIARICAAVKTLNPNCAILVDNCYGEFVEDKEPTAAGADLVAGSLIKNPGGGLALTGGYIAGRTKMVDAALNRLTAPGIGGHLGLTHNQNRLVLQGLFLAPSVVAQAVKGALLFAHVFDKLGFQVAPGPQSNRTDIIQAIALGSAERLISFCRAIQKFSPVNSHVAPEPAEMPGYQHKVVMAGGTFIEGATIELSADGPMREPFAVFFQGGLTYLHVRYVLEELLKGMAAGDQWVLYG
jgi:cystathionine beta-lyase family protein involved in aluminum resistance